MAISRGKKKKKIQNTNANLSLIKAGKTFPNKKKGSLDIYKLFFISPKNPKHNLTNHFLVKDRDQAIQLFDVHKKIHNPDYKPSISHTEDIAFHTRPKTNSHLLTKH